MVQQTSFSKEYFIKFLIGGFSGALSQTLLSPFINIKLRIHNSQYLYQTKIIQKPLKGLMQAGISIVKQKGFTQLWQGNLKNSKNAFWFQAILFTTKDFMQSTFQVSHQKVNYLKHFLANTCAGMIAGISALTAIFPTGYPRVMLVKMNGVKDFYKNFHFYLVPTLIYRGFYFGLYDSFKVYLEKDHNFYFFQIIALSFLSTLTAYMISAPFETAKIQLLKKDSKEKYSGSFNCLKKVFIQGLQENMTFRFPILSRITMASLSLVVYQIFIQKLSLQIISSEF